MTDDVLNRVREYWLSCPNVRSAPPAQESSIALFEGENHVRLPDVLKQFFTVANGFLPGGDQDERGFSFWPIQRVVSAKAFDDGHWSSPSAANCFVFADYLSLSWGYAVRLDPDGGSSAVCIVGTADGTAQWVADDFESFLELYLRDDDQIYVASQITTLGDAAEDYCRLIGSFVREELAAGDFVRQFLDRFKTDTRPFDEVTFALLDELFGVADSYTADRELYSTDPSFYVTEDRLRSKSARILLQLQQSSSEVSRSIDGRS